MGCCYKKNYILRKIDDLTNEFYLKSISHDFTIAQVNEFNKKTLKNYFEFWSLTKVLGIHSNYTFQLFYWEAAYVFITNSNLNIIGILLVFLLLCKANPQEKIDYVKYFLSENINHSKERDANLIMNLYEFKKILLVYFSCLTFIPLNIYLKIKEMNKENEKEKATFEKLIKEKFVEENIKIFTDFMLKDYVKKNFYVNAGKFFDENINFLIDDKLIRMTVYKFNFKNLTLTPNLASNDEDDKESQRHMMPTFQKDFVEENNKIKNRSKDNKKQKTISISSSNELVTTEGKKIQTTNKDKYK